jgi:DNA-binding NtrC family response regulator
MARTTVIMVCDDPGMIETGRSFAQSHGCNFQSYNQAEWSQKGVSLETNVPSLSAGSLSVEGGAKILQFPQRTANSDAQKVKTMNELESLAISNAINEYNGNLTEAAKALGIGRATLYRKVKQYSIDTADARKKRAA